MHFRYIYEYEGNEWMDFKASIVCQYTNSIEFKSFHISCDSA